MNTPSVFDSRDAQCKKPYGALPCGKAWSLTCRPLSSEGFTHCSVIIRREFAGHEMEAEMPFSGFQDGRAFFSLSLIPFQTPELVWYWFRFWRDDGTGCLLDKTGYRSEGEPIPWQLTVYEERPTPAWFGEGVTYQIFPDRYCRLETPDPSGLIGDRWVHQDWDDGPVWWPEEGEIKNRDFFGGSLAGVAAHLDDLAALGVSTLYFCPIFESASNHRYNTADYTKIDPMLGAGEDFRDLCAKAKEKGIRVLLDGVFNHTGSQSVYFNADGFYPTLGAAQSKDSPYYDWFQFSQWPASYDAWWGIRTLPAVRALYAEGIVTGTQGKDGKLIFNPAGNLTRAQAAAMIGRSQEKGCALAELTFTDAAQIPGYATFYIRTMAAQGILSGYADGAFRPQANITRGQMAKILYTML